MVFIRVVLPEPFSPTKNVKEFLGTQQLASQIISFESRTTVRSQHSTIFSVGLLTIDVICLLFRCSRSSDRGRVYQPRSGYCKEEAPDMNLGCLPHPMDRGQLSPGHSRLQILLGKKLRVVVPRKLHVHHVL